MKEAYIFLCGSDREYLVKLCAYLQAHRVMRSRYYICTASELPEALERNLGTLLVLEGEEMTDLYDRYTGKLPILWLVDDSVKEGHKQSTTEKYQSAKIIGELMKEVYYRHHDRKDSGVRMIGVFHLGVQDALGELCEFLKKRQKKALIVNLEFFSPFPGQEDLRCMNLSDFVMKEEVDLYREDFPPYEIGDGIYGIQTLTCMEDCQEIQELKNLAFLQEYAGELGVDSLYIFFGGEIVPWFSLIYHCQEIVAISDPKEYFRKEWFLSYWKKKAEDVTVRFSLEEIA